MRDSDDEVERCVLNLRMIHEAIEAHRLETRDLPDVLSDLVPRYLAEPATLVCPTSARTGQTSLDLAGGYSDSWEDAGVSYLYEFLDETLPGQRPTLPHLTGRQWKRLQMGWLGSDVPIVRCLLHGSEHTLNLSFGGEVYKTGYRWEERFLDIVRMEELETFPLQASFLAPTIVAIPRRDAVAPVGSVPLDAFYNLSFADPPVGARSVELPLGESVVWSASLAKVFDLRGMILLGRPLSDYRLYPSSVGPIPLTGDVRRLSVLWGCLPGSNSDQERLLMEARFSTGVATRTILQGGGGEGDNVTRVVNMESSPARLFWSRWESPQADTPLRDVVFRTLDPKAIPFIIGLSVDDLRLDQ